MGARLALELSKGLTPERKQSLFMKGLEILNRTNSATMGFVAEGIESGKAFEGLADGFFGRRTFGGQDVVAAITGEDPDSKLARRVGLVADILNPLDPLNYVGVGGLTKAGRFAKAAIREADLGVSLGKTVHRIPFKSEAKFIEERAKILRKRPEDVVVPEFAEGIGAQAKAGQRGLVTFRNPITGDTSALVRGGRVLSGFGAIGGVVKKHKVGKGIQEIFGGKQGEFLAGVQDPEIAKQLQLAMEEGVRQRGLFEARAGVHIDLVNNSLNSLESAEMTQMISRIARNPETKNQLYSEFINAAPNLKKQKARQAALDAGEDYMKLAQAHSERLPGGLYPESGGIGDTFQSRQFLPKAGTPEDQLARALRSNSPLEPPVELVGFEKNVFNASMLPRATQPVTEGALTESGQAIFHGAHREGQLALAPHTAPPGVFSTEPGVVSGQEWFQSLDGADKIRFLDKHRLTFDEQAEALSDVGRLVQDKAAIMEDFTRQVGEAVEVDDLLMKLHDTVTGPKGTSAAPFWDVDPKLFSDGNWVKVSQGRWKDRPIAVPRALADAFEHFQKVNAPTPDKPWFAQAMNKFLPESMKDPGLLSWWRALAITGGSLNVPGFLNRNFWTGVFHNDLEGLGPSSVRGIVQSIRHYGNAAKMMDSPAKFLKKFSRAGENVEGDIIFKLRDGTEVRMAGSRFVEEYRGRGLSGGGGQEVEKLNEIKNASTKLRNQVFGGFFNANEKVEFMLRAPLAMKYMEDSLELAQLMGRKLPKRLDDMVPGDVGDVAMVSAREAVFRAHFDYGDLSKFEREIRNNFIPFYTFARKAAQFHTINMMQDFGKYTKFTRGYWNAFEQQGITPDDLPDWAAKSFAVPISPSEENMARWMDFTSFLPFMDVLQAGETLGTAVGALPFVTGFSPPLGATPTSELLRFFAVRGNPAITLPAELGLQRGFFDRRRFGQDTPEDLLGFAVPTSFSKAVKGAFPPVKKAEQINPFDIFGTERKSRSEVKGKSKTVAKLSRTFVGLPIREAEKNVSDLSRKQATNRLKKLKRSRKKARDDQDRGRERFFQSRIDELEGQLGR